MKNRIDVLPLLFAGSLFHVIVGQLAKRDTLIVRTELSVQMQLLTGLQVFPDQTCQQGVLKHAATEGDMMDRKLLGYIHHPDSQGVEETACDQACILPLCQIVEDPIQHGSPVYSVIYYR